MSSDDAASSEAEPTGPQCAEFQSTDLQCTEVFYTGNVQGVGFRYTVNQIAKRFAVVGYVENLADGRVHLLAEGEPRVLKDFLAAIAERMARNIFDVQQHTASTASQPERLTTFSIRR